MNEEELFCKLFPEYVVNGKPLSPYFDLFESGYEQSEKRIDELEAEVKEWKDKADLWCKTANLKDHNIMINKELEKENADLKEEINKIAFARGILEEENAELKEELKKWKDEWQEQVQKATDEGYARTLQTIQLTKAKEIIKNLLSAYISYADSFDDRDNQIVSEAEQFLNSEVEKC